MKALVLCMLAAAAIMLSGGARSAFAQQPQPIDAAQRAQVQPQKPPPRTATPAGKQVSKKDAKTSQPTNKSPGMALAFWGFALLAIGGSLFVITRKNLIAAVMGMVGTFFAVAALYMMLYAHFLAVIQMLVYAGAIMVLFVFVIMILNKPEDEPYPTAGLVGKIVAGLAMAYLVYRLGGVLISVDRTATGPQLDAPRPTAQGYDWGSTASVGWNLFTDYLFAFEAVSILLLIAVVGAIAIARPLKDDVVEGPDLDSPGVKP